MARRTIKVDVLARVEGEGSLFLAIENGAVTEAQLKIFEPPRFFEAFLRGRDFRETPDITSRICGICPIAYQMSSINAMEQITGVTVPTPIRDLRRLMYYGEWIESHALHMFMLHAPDFLGYESAIAMAKDHGEWVQRGLALKKAGNQIMEVLGGREIHPINMRVGGFYRVPTTADLAVLIEPLKRARDIAADAAQWVATFDFPDFERDYEFVALTHPDEYAIIEGRLISSRGMNIDISEFDAHFREEHVKHTNALHCAKHDGSPYFVGPMARYALNYEQLSPFAKQVASAGGLGKICTNPFKAIIVRAVEVALACDEALKIIENYSRPDAPGVEVAPRAGTGFGCTEAPRGICWHRYTIDEAGKIQDARIVPPTSQNQKMIEADLRDYAGPRTALSDEQLQWQLEQAIRNYDPCISCATHFLNLTVSRK